MAVTADAPVPQELVDQIAATDGFIAGRAVSLSSRPSAAARTRSA